ncbi:hypothetical protein Cpir12675_002611 [Ceratocystis pirilliformis]|uniref:Uncharacterized protein n=1 Tax=Ceratocystis pirilliformis TaxID=259994 RepID=A0ABR3Z8A0_9PEZI
MLAHHHGTKPSCEPLPWPPFDFSQVDHEKASQYTLQIEDSDAIQYGRLHDLFGPLLLEPHALLRHHKKHSYWGLGLVEDDHLPGFMLPQIQITDDYSDLQSYDYATHVIEDDATPAESDFTIDFAHAAVERDVKLTLPLLHSDNDRDMDDFLSMRLQYRYFNITEFVLPLEPVNDDKDEGMLFPDTAISLLCLLDSEIESESLNFSDVAEGWIRLLSPPLSPIQQAIEPFMPWGQTSKIDTPDSDVPSLLELDLATANEAASQSCPHDSISDEAFEVALANFQPHSSSPPQKIQVCNIKLEPPVLKPESPVALNKKLPFVIDLAEDDLLSIQMASKSCPPIPNTGDDYEVIILEDDLQEFCESKAQAINLLVGQERVHYHETALRMTAPTMDFSSPTPVWALSFDSITATFQHIIKVFSKFFDFSISRSMPDPSINHLPWKPWPSFSRKWVVVEQIELFGDFKNCHTLLGPIPEENVWDSTSHFSFLEADFEEDELQTISSFLCSPKTEPVPLKARPPETPTRNPASQLTSRFFPSSDSLAGAPHTPLQKHPSLMASQNNPVLFTPKSSSPPLQKPNAHVDHKTSHKRHGDLMADIMAMKRLKPGRQKNKALNSTDLLSSLSNSNPASQHLTNFMNIMNPPNKTGTKSSPLFSHPVTKTQQTPASISKNALFSVSNTHGPTAADLCPPTSGILLSGRYFVSVSIGSKLTRLLQKLQPNIVLLDRNYSRYNTFAEDSTSLQPLEVVSELSFEADISISLVSGILIAPITALTREKAILYQRVQKVSYLYQNLEVLISAGDVEGSSYRTPLQTELDAYTGLCCFSASLSNTVSVHMVPGGHETLAKWIVRLLEDRHHETQGVSCCLTVDESNWERLFRTCGLNVCASQTLVRTLETQWGGKGLVAFFQMTAEQRVAHYSEILGSDPSMLQRVSAALDRKWG